MKHGFPCIPLDLDSETARANGRQAFYRSLAAGRQARHATVVLQECKTYKTRAQEQASLSVRCLRLVVMQCNATLCRLMTESGQKLSWLALNAPSNQIISVNQQSGL